MSIRLFQPRLLGALFGVVLLPGAVPAQVISVNAPVIVVQPGDQTVNPGVDVTFLVEANGAPPLTYQWRVGGEILPAATNATLVLSNVQSFDSGRYSVVVANAQGSVTSRDAILVVLGRPVIQVAPRNIRTTRGADVEFSVVAQGLAPLAYQWQFNDADLAGETNAVLRLTNVQDAQAGAYRVRITNPLGAVESDAVTLTLVELVEDHTEFQITSLANTNSRVFPAQVFADERGGIAVSGSSLFVSGNSPLGEGVTARYALPGLGNPSELEDVAFDCIVSDLRTERVYALSDGTNALGRAGGMVAALMELHPDTAIPTGNIIELTTPIPAFFGGLFAGYGRIVILDHLFNVHEIQLPSGFVQLLGRFDLNNWQAFPHIHPDTFPDAPYTADNPIGTWAFWGVAEKIGGVTWLVYVQDRNTIVRRRVPDGRVEVASTYNGFFDLGYGEMGRFTVSPRNGRWYFHHEEISAFFFEPGGGADFTEQTVGYAAATFDIDTGIYPAHYVWGPLRPLQPVNVPFPVQLTALTTSRGPALDFQETLTLSATNSAGDSVPISPTTISNWVDGVWTNAITILSPGVGIRLLAADELGLVGFSAPFTASANDLAVFIEDTPDPVAVNAELTYTIEVLNTGPGAATGVRLTNTLPPQVNFVAATSLQGNCSPTNGQVICDLDTIPQGQASQVSVTIIPAVIGSLTNQVSVSRLEPDPNPTNNQALATTTVTGPLLVIDDAETVEGDAGAHPVTFTVRLLQSSTNTITVDYATANATANPRDFLRASGTLTFLPNVTTQTFTVTVRSDRVFELDEQFIVNLSRPVNGTLSDPQAFGLIRDDDAPPTVSVTDTNLVESDTGTNNLRFAIRLSTVTGVPVQVTYATSNGTATAGSDYLPVVGEVVFPADIPALLRFVNIPILADTEAEADETFTFHLVSATNSVLATTQATGTIADDDLTFVWSPIPTPLPFNVPIPVSVSARLFDGTLVADFNEAVQFNARVPSPPEPGNMLGNVAHQNNDAGNFTIGHDFTLDVDVRVTHVRHYAGDKVSVWDSDGRLVFSQDVLSQPGTWTETPLPSPVRLAGGQTYRIAFHTGADGWYLTSAYSPTFAHGTLGNRWFNNGDTYPTTAIDDPVIFLVDLAYLAERPPTPVAISPTSSDPFANGTWSGTIQFLSIASNAVLYATDTAHHFGASQPLDILTVVGADLDLAMSVSANPAPASNQVVFKLYAANHGPGEATNVFLTNPIPAGLTLHAAWASQGSVSTNNDVLIFDLGTIASGGAAFLTTTLGADTEGEYTYTGTLSTDSMDTDAANNTAEIRLAVCGDCDNDGLPDAWERRFGLNPRNPADALLDPDGDGLTNLDEFLNGTNPLASDIPVILLHPSSVVADTGDSVNFEVAGEGTEPLSYQWYRYGEPVPGATNLTLAITNAQMDANGIYTAVVSNPYGAATSAVARLTLDAQLTFRILELSTNNVTAVEVNGIIGDDRGGIAVSADRAFLTGDGNQNEGLTARWWLPNLNNASVNANHRYDGLVSDLQSETVYTLASNTIPMHRDWFNTSGRIAIDALMELDPVTGEPTTNQILLSTNILLGNRSGIFAGYGRILLYDRGDRTVYHIALPSGAVSSLGRVALLNANNSESWAFWGLAEFYGGDLYLVYARDAQTIERFRVPDGLTQVVGRFNNLSDMASLTFSTSLSRWLFHHEGGSQFFSGNEALGIADARFTTNPDYPVIQALLGDAVGLQDSNVTFQVQASGGEPLVYQWFHDGAAIEEANSPVLTLANLQLADAGRYRVAVSNQFGMETAALTFTVLGLPVITESPPSQQVATDGVAVFTVTADGAPPLHYQWQYNGTPLPGATATTLTVTGVTTNDAGFYAVQVSNVYGAVLSAAAELSVIEAGQFTDDFEPGIDLVQWLEFGGRVGDTVLATNFGGSVSGQNSLWFGDDGQRFATSRALNTLSGGTIAFWIRMGDSSFPWEDPDSGEDVVFEYSVDGGNTWVEVVTVDNGTTDWTNFTLPIPAGAQSAGTLFRWRQLRNSGNCCDHWALDDVAITTGPTPPAIIAQPLNQSVFAGRSATFRVVASGSMPLRYQWRFNGADLVAGTNATLVIDPVTPEHVGRYSVFVTNIYGSALSAEATLELSVDDQTQFRITALTTNHSFAIEHNEFTGDDRGGIAASATQLFVTGDSRTARFSLADLSGGVRLPEGNQYDSLIADLRTETVYLLANGNTPLTGPDTVTSLLELNGATGLPTGRRISLSQPIPVGDGAGLFSGYARAVIFTGSRVFSIQLPAGTVVDLGPLSNFNHNFSENWAFWGVTEHWAGETYLVYVENSLRIVRRRVSDNAREVIAEFESLSDMASITVSVPWGRWYFHHEGTSQFFSGDEVAGYADATFEVDSGIYPVRFEWGPIAALKPAGRPFPVTLRALSSSSNLASNFTGAVRLTARSSLGLPVGLTPNVVTNFVGGVWSGDITVLASAPGIILTATDDSGITGRSAPFDARNGFTLLAAAAPDPVIVGQDLTYSLQVFNTEAILSTGVRLTNTLPPGVEFVRITPAQGACTNDNGVIVCDLQTIDADGSADVTLVIRPAVVGMLTNAFELGRNEPDANPSDRQAEVVTQVVGPPLAIDDLVVTEGGTGAFTVRLLQPSTNTITVRYSAVNGTADPRDYRLTPGMLTFPPNVTTQAIPVTIVNDTRFELEEFFTVTLANPVNASFADAEAIGTIQDDDPQPSVSIGDLTVLEGDSGMQELRFNLTLSDFAGVPVQVVYATSNVTATAGLDFEERVGEVVFLANFQRAQVIRVPVLGDTLAEADETFSVHLLQAVNAIIDTPEATATIEDDDVEFVWDTIPSPQPVNVPFPVQLSTRYFDGTLASNFTGTVSFQASVGSIDTNTIGLGRATNNFPLGAGWEDERTQVIYLASEIGRAGPISAIALDVAQAPNIPLSTWTVRMRHTPLSRYSFPYVWESNDWTTVYHDNLTVPGRGWLTLQFSTPFPYNGTDNLMVDFSFHNSDTGLEGWCRTTFQNDTRTLYQQAFDFFGYGPPLTWAGDFPFPNSTTATPNLRVIFDTFVSLPVLPAASGNFVGGVWAGELTVGRAETGVQLRAVDATRHFGRSNPFNVHTITTTDLALSLATATPAVDLGDTLTFDLTVTNQGPATATFVIASNPVPAGMTLVSATTSQGSVIQREGEVSFNLLNLPPGLGAAMTATFRADTEGLVTNRAGVRSSLPDSDPANNRAELVVEVLCTDCDHDGMPDAWERAHQLNPADPADANQDADQDGLSNLEEYWAGTDPRDIQDVVRLRSIEINNHQDVQLTFEGKPGNTYVLERAEQMTGPWVPVAAFRLGAMRNVELTDFGAGTLTNRFYRVSFHPHPNP